MSMLGGQVSSAARFTSLTVHLGNLLEETVSPAQPVTHVLFSKCRATGWIWIQKAAGVCPRDQAPGEHLKATKTGVDMG